MKSVKSEQKDSILTAIGFALINAFMLAAMSLAAKQLSAYFGPFEITFFRNAFSTIALIIWFYFANKTDFFKTDKPLMHLFRGTIGTIGIVLGAWALSMMPLAETTILLFTSPLFTVLLSYPLLGERVGPYRLSAVAAGFIGVIIMANPLNENLTQLPLLGIIVGLGWGFSSGMVDIWLRLMGKTENPNTTTFYFVLFGSIVTGMHWPFANVTPLSFSISALGLIGILGITGLSSQLAKTYSYKLAEASLIAPIMYTMIVWAMLFDYIFWNKIPQMNVITGASLIIASNLFILYRERRKKSSIITNN